MTEDNRMGDQTPRMPNFWWSPTNHLYRGGDKRPCADAVRLVPESAEHQQPPPAPRVFFPGDTVPAGTFVLDRRGGVITGNGVVMPSTEPWLVQGETWTFVELQHPSPEEWQATVDRAKATRASDPGTGEA